MKSVDEILWNYIDGNCTEIEHDNVARLIECDETYRLKYQQLLNLNSEFSAMDLEEPPMAFTYNVLETIRTDNAQQPLKAAINKRIIWSVTTFFVLTIVTLLVYTFRNISFSGSMGSVNIPAVYTVPNIGSYIKKPLIEGFLFFDLVLGLFLFDAYLRNKKASKVF